MLAPSLDELPAQTRRLLLLIDEMVKQECERLEMERLDYSFHAAHGAAVHALGRHPVAGASAAAGGAGIPAVRRGAPGQTFVYQLNFETDANGRPVLAGLSQLYNYDGNCAGVNDHCAGGARAVAGG